ncbi:L-aspartate oxidase [Candidatus Saganbacteria bacterium]|nr:L-aspartate oxidase [Candidatus Saganbacteria bacterium]
MISVERCDFLIVGGGIAGLSATLEAAKYGRVAILTKSKIGETATTKAQGGIAAAVDSIKDSTQFHFEDTIAAGAGLCDPAAVKILVTEGVDRVRELIKMGAQFDKAETGGGFALSLEGAHKRRRILHAGDATGKEIQRTLGTKIVEEKSAKIYQDTIGIDLLLDTGRCYGIKALDIKSQSLKYFLAPATIITTGGLGQVYLHTTNPEVATGDGIAMAWRAGAEVTDMEFVQFHPTSMVQSAELRDLVAIPQFLISEAVRGEGGVLLNDRGERFMEKYHSALELAPRDIVARAIFQEMRQTGADCVYLSLKQIDPEKIKKRFPVIYKTCLERGLDISKDNIPVAPAAHYFMGGIKTDTDGKTNLPGLYAAGECAALGVHGANRLASNSLLDGLVFGHRAALAATSPLSSSDVHRRNSFPSPSEMERGDHSEHKRGMVGEDDIELQRFKLIIKSAMWNGTGIVRSKESLNRTKKMLEDVASRLDYEPATKEDIELKNLALVARLITQAALDRQESRGAHFRSDFPKIDDLNWQRHLIYSAG